MTIKQGNALFAIAGIFIASYVIRSLVNATQQYAFYQRQARIAQMRRQAQAKAAAAKPKPTPAIAAPSAPATAVMSARSKPAPPALVAKSKLNGIWYARTAIEKRGLCGMKLELREGEPGSFQGYSSLTCSSVTPLMAAKDRGNAGTALLNQMNAQAAVLSGTLQDGAIHFKVDKTVGADIEGCVVTGFTVTPFGSLLAAQWQSGTCPAGRALLGKIRP